MGVLRFQGAVRLNWGAVFHCAPDWYWDTAKTPFHDFDLWGIFDGVGILEAPSGRYELRAGDCFLLRPQERYIVRQDADRPLTVLVIHFDFLTAAGRPRRLREAFLPPLHRRIRELIFFRLLMTRALECHEAGNQNAANTWLQACLEEIDRQDREWAEGGQTDERTLRIESLCARILQSPEASYRVAEMARALHISPDHFTRFFKRVKGITPHEFIIRTHIDASRKLLLSSSHSISRIAYLAGYTDVYHFSKQFKQRTGMTPTRYRRSREGSLDEVSEQRTVGERGTIRRAKIH